MTTSAGLSRGSKCRCCPYGFHICVDFVSFAENVSSGFEPRTTPTLGRRNMNNNGHDRVLMSPLDSIFSDSLENIMSDFEEALAPQQKSAEVKKTNGVTDIRNRLQNGYLSDYTGYRSRTAENPKSRPPAPPFELAPSRSFSRTNGHYNDGSTTPIKNGFSTALGKTISEIKARNAESPFPGQESQVTSRVGTPIDLGITTPRFPTRNEDYRDFDRPTQLPPTPTPLWQRTPSHGDIRPAGDFTSLRRGREYAISDSESANQRIRFYSTSPKIQRRLQVAPQIEDSSFTYAQQNGHTVLARTQATSMSPRDDLIPKTAAPKVTKRSVAVSTGPLPPAKPCSECPALRKELEALLERLNRPMASKETLTDVKTYVEKGVGEAIRMLSVGVATEATTSTCVDNNTQTEVKATAEAEINTCCESKSGCSQTENPVFHHFGVNTDEVEKKTTEDLETMTDGPSSNCVESQTEQEEPKVQEEEKAKTSNSEAQTEDDQKESVQVPEECQECQKRQDVFTRNVGVGSCTVEDKICVSCDDCVEEVDENEAPGFKAEDDGTRSREFEIAKNNAVKKLLTSEQKHNFVRGSQLSKSARMERKRSVDDLDYIEQKKKAPSAPPTVPNGEQTDALKSKVVLKKELTAPPSKVPDPIPARIPRPKFVKYVPPEEHAATPDEEDEAADRLTPLRSELRSIGRWPRNSSPQIPYSSSSHDRLSDSEGEDSDDSEGTYDANDDVTNEAPFEISTPLREALESLNSHLLQPGSVSSETADWALKYVQHEWMKTAARKVSRFDHVDKFVEQLRELGPVVLRTIVNITDQNGNSALHYAVSHGNFPVVSSLLDSNECELNHANKAGYTAVMLGALSSLEDDMERAVVQRLFEMGDVNVRATQHGQTALMLAVSHGKKETMELLLQCNADVNIQDEDGSTALMCAAEHGHREIVKLLLSQPNIDASLADCDSSTALSIAVENGHRDIGVLIYAHLNYTRLDSFQESSTI